MKGNVLESEPLPAAAPPGQAEPLEAAVREVSARIAQNREERRQLVEAGEELRALAPGLRRRRSRALPVAARPVTFFSLEPVTPATPEQL